MNLPHVMVIEDEKDLRDILIFHLEESQYKVNAFETGEAALRAVQKVKPDLILLDLMLPGINGVDFCRRIKLDRNMNDIRIIMVTARGEESEIVEGLKCGADDYITKPFSPRVLLARVRAVLRRDLHGASPEEKLNRGVLEMDKARHLVTLEKKPVELTASEFKALWLLAERQGRVYTRSQIVEHVKGGEYPVTDRSVDVMMVGLRKKLGKFGDSISTVRGIGYRFIE